MVLNFIWCLLYLLTCETRKATSAKKNTHTHKNHFELAHGGEGVFCPVFDSLRCLIPGFIVKYLKLDGHDKLEVEKWTLLKKLTADWHDYLIPNMQAHLSKILEGFAICNKMNKMSGDQMQQRLRRWASFFLNTGSEWLGVFTGLEDCWARALSTQIDFIFFLNWFKNPKIWTF